MDEKRLHEKLDKIGEDIHNIKIVQVIHTEQLSEHMRRTELLEKSLELHEKHDSAEHKEFEKKLEPMDEFIKSIKGIKHLLWFITAAGAALAVISRWL